MRKLIKITTLLLCLALLGVFLSGCSYIDELRKSHAILSDDKSTITFQGKTYKKLPRTDKELYCKYNFGSNYYHDDIFITDESIPLLLMEGFSYSGTYDPYKDTFCIYDIDIDFVDMSKSDFYCNEADYERYVNALNCDELNYIGFEYETWDLNGDNYCVLEVTNSVLNEEIKDYVMNPQKMTEDVYEKFLEDQESLNFNTLYSGIYKCDETASVVELLNGFDIMKTYEGDKAYIVNYDTETAAVLSEKATIALKQEYFTGYFPGIVEENGEVYFIN